MDKLWFELKDFEKKKYCKDVWIPLYISQYIENESEFGYLGFKEDYLNCETLAIPLEYKEQYMNQQSDLNFGFGQTHDSWAEKTFYKTVYDFIDDDNKVIGTYLVLKQDVFSMEEPEYHLNQDLVFALGLKREGNSWICPKDGYIEVVRLTIDEVNQCVTFEIKSEYLNDYLCARGMGLMISSYRERREISNTKPEFNWSKDEAYGSDEQKSWDRHIREIHEGGHFFGDSIAVYHSVRTDVDFSADVPDMDDIPTDENVKTESYIKNFNGRKLYCITGRFWKKEWIHPSDFSFRVRGDKEPDLIYFTIDAGGNKESKKTLTNAARWLFFKPTVINEIIDRRGSVLKWYTAQTGSVGCLIHNDVHFGVNQLGLINVYAKDIANLPNWQQQIWVGHNIVPEGKVSHELLQSQVEAIPAETQAPEHFLLPIIIELNYVFNNEVGFALINLKDEVVEIIKKCHRFRGNSLNGLYALAKDLARITADSINSSKLIEIVKPPKGTKWGSLKSLEKFLATLISDQDARSLMSPLFAIYDLRLADAHIPKSSYEDQFALLNINASEPYVMQAFQMLNIFATTLNTISYIVKHKK